MPSVYLYLSTAKLDQLLSQEPGFWAGVTATLDFKLPFVSGGLSGTQAKSSIARLEKLEKRIQKQYSPPLHDEIPEGSAPVFVRFKGRAVRGIQESEFYLALDHPATPLLLAGSASFALGAAPGSKKDYLFSPSGDPVGTFVRAFKATRPAESDLSDHINHTISYMWESVIGESIRSHANLPTVEGLAIYATTAQATRQWPRRPEVKEIVVGTPLFVRQVQQGPAASDADAAAAGRKRFQVEVLRVDKRIWGDDDDKNQLSAIIYKLHCLGYRVADGRWCSSDAYLSEFRRQGRWNRIFVLHPSRKRGIAEHIQSVLQSDRPTCDIVTMDEAVSINGENTRELIADGADVSVLLCSG